MGQENFEEVTEGTLDYKKNIETEIEEETLKKEGSGEVFTSVMGPKVDTRRRQEYRKFNVQ